MIERFELEALGTYLDVYRLTLECVVVAFAVDEVTVPFEEMGWDKDFGAKGREEVVELGRRGGGKGRDGA